VDGHPPRRLIARRTSSSSTRIQRPRAFLAAAGTAARR
jgi:hypothetical protein